MPSPFPGMNPYLEHPAVWPSFHSRFIVALADQLTVQADPAFFVDVGVHIYVHEWPLPVGYADVGVSSGARAGGPSPVNSAAATEATTRTALVNYPSVEEERIPFLEVRDRASRRIVAVVELLSPSNKNSGADREAYLAKRVSLFIRDVNFVEIDLLRGGPQMPNKNVPASAYSVLVSRAARRPVSDYWAIGLRDPLPTIPVPLRDDFEPLVNLQAALHLVYDAARYGSRIYDDPPVPALSRDDAAWAAQFVPPPSA
jgi:hypothetical protein